MRRRFWRSGIHKGVLPWNPVYRSKVSRQRRTRMPDDCSESWGWCTPLNQSLQQMTECTCVHNYSGCTTWRSGPSRIREGWHGRGEVFGELADVLAEIIASKKEAAGEDPDQAQTE